LNPRPLGYEPYDARPRRPAWSLFAALTSVNRRSTFKPNLGVSPVAPYPAASRAQIRAQIRLLTRGIDVLTSASASGLLRNSAYVHQVSSRCLRYCPGVTVTALGRPPHRARSCGPVRRSSPIGLTAAGLFAGEEASRPDSRVRWPGTLTCTRCPAVISGLYAVAEACDNPAAVWWGILAVSTVTQDQVAIVKPIAKGLASRPLHRRAGLPVSLEHVLAS